MLDNSIDLNLYKEACKIHNRRFIGIELDKNYYVASCERLNMNYNSELKMEMNLLNKIKRIRKLTIDNIINLKFEFKSIKV